MVSVPERGLQLLFGVTDQVIVVLPEPPDGENVSQPGALLDADQLQGAPAVNVTVPLLALALGLAPAAESE